MRYRVDKLFLPSLAMLTNSNIRSCDFETLTFNSSSGCQVHVYGKFHHAKQGRSDGVYRDIYPQNQSTLIFYVVVLSPCND